MVAGTDFHHLTSSGGPDKLVNFEISIFPSRFQRPSFSVQINLTIVMAEGMCVGGHSFTF